MPSNGLNTDGSLMNVGNKLGDRPCIKLYPQYSSGSKMKTLLADCGGLGQGDGGEKKSTTPNSHLKSCRECNKPTAMRLKMPSGALRPYCNEKCWSGGGIGGAYHAPYGKDWVQMSPQK
jgi:hypothetical protein